MKAPVYAIIKTYYTTTNKNREKYIFIGARFLSQNVRGRRSSTRQANIDVAIGIMEKNRLDAYVVQETWLDGSTHLEINGYHVFTHGHDKQHCSRGQAGVAIILSPTLYHAYQASNCPDPFYLSDPESVQYGRFISITFDIMVDNRSRGAFRQKRKRPSKTPMKICISSAYSPCEHEEQTVFNEFLNSFYSSIPNGTLLYQGQDMNADLGTCSTDETTKLTIGKHGLQRRNKKGTDTISLLQTNNLQVATTHFEHDDYITWTSFGRTKSKHQLDHWVTNKLDTIHDAKVTELGVDSDHSATLIRIDLKTARRKRKKEKTTLCYALLQNKDIR